MSTLRFDTDSIADVEALKTRMPYLSGVPEVFQRRTRYGDAGASQLGLEPVEGVPDVLVPKDSYKELIERCHKEKSFPMYHMYSSWCPKGTKWNQNGLGYCWTWSGTACILTVRQTEGKELVPLAPVSMGHLVGWKNQGNYLESFIKGAKEVGIAPASYVPNQHDPNPNKFKEGWDVERRKYRLGSVWDTNGRAGDATMVQHCVSILCYGRPLYVAYSWWGHAVPVVAVRFDPSVLYGIVWVIRNSHNEEDVIELTGSRGVPDEAFGFIDTVLSE